MAEEIIHFEAELLRVVIENIAASKSFLSTIFGAFFSAVVITPVPMALVRTKRSPVDAFELVICFSGFITPVTAKPYFGSSSSNVWPPMIGVFASPAFDAPPSKIEDAVSSGNCEGKPNMLRAAIGVPPTAKTSERALAAAISPYVKGSSTIGGKKSNVSTNAKSLFSL